MARHRKARGSYSELERRIKNVRTKARREMRAKKKKRSQILSETGDKLERALKITLWNNSSDENEFLDNINKEIKKTKKGLSSHKKSSRGCSRCQAKAAAMNERRLRTLEKMKKEAGS